MPDMTGEIRSGGADVAKHGAIRNQPPTMTSAANIKTPPGTATSPAPAPILDPEGAHGPANGEIIARPLVRPGHREIVMHNKSIALRWVFRGGRDGHRMNECESMGFEYATPADCEVPGMKPRDGRWIWGDLILMKIAKSDYEGALLYNEQLARAHLAPKATIARGASFMAQELSGIRGPAESKAKIAMMTESEHMEAIAAVPGGPAKK